MTQRTTIRCAVICVLVLSVGVLSVVGVGIAESATNETKSATIVSSGKGNTIFSNENETTLKDVSIDYNSKENISEINIFISTVELKEAGIELNSSRISSYNISGANISNISKQDHQNHTVFKIQVMPRDSSEEIILNRIIISHLDTSNVNSTSKSRYGVGVSTSKSGENYSELKEEERIITSESFQVVANSIGVPDQATISSQILNDSTTSAGVTVADLVSNVDSVVLITQGYNGTRLAGYKHQSATSIDGRQNISIRPNLIGGKMGVYVIPENDIDMTKYDSGDYIPETILKSAIATDKAHIYSGTVEINNQTHNKSISSSLTISRAELLDLNGDNTPYIISVHPITADGNVVYGSVYGYSNKLTGSNQDIQIDVENQSGANQEIYNTNQLAATLQMYDGNADKNSTKLNSSYVLPNSDFHNQFVDGGISDTALINVKENVTSERKEIQIAPQNGNNETQPTIYAGSTVIADNTLLENTSKDLYRIDGDRYVISTVGSSIEGTESRRYHTKGFETGTYTFGKNSSEYSFRIIGSEEQYIRIQDIGDPEANGEIIDTEVQHNAPRPVIQITDSDTTAATVELETPDKGETTVKFNTYAAANGSLNESFSVMGPGSSIESVTTPGGNGTLQPGAYEISIRSEQGVATTSDNTTVTLGRRSTNGLTTYTGTEADRSDLGSATAVRGAIESGTLSQSERVTANDTVVYAVNASGLTGLATARGATTETGDDLDRLDGLEFGVRSTGGEDEQSASDALGGMPPNSTVHVDETGLYVVADGDDALPTDREPEPGEEFTAEFRVTDDRLREVASDPPDGHRVTSTVAFAAADANESTGDDRDRTASGGPVGGGSGTGGESAGRGGGTGGTEGTAGGAPPSGPAGGNRPDEANASGAAGPDETPNRVHPAWGVRSGFRPSVVGRMPLLHGPIAVSPPTGTGGAGVSGGTDTTEADAPSIDAEAATDGSDGSRTAGDETGGSERATPNYENAPIRATAEDVPGFGPLQSLTALALALLAATRRRRGR